MKKRLFVLFVGLLVIPLVVFAYKSNSYQIQLDVAATTAISLPTGPKDILIQNDDGTDALWVDLDSNTTTSCSSATEGCILIGADEEIAVYDFYTDGITLIKQSGHVSPVTVVITY